MATEIRVWQIENEGLKPINTSMCEEERKECDLEKWIKSNPSILGEDILIIGEQVEGERGELDFLGVDKSGNLVIIELKRGELKKEVLVEALDYASGVANWDVKKLNEVCELHTKSPLEEYITTKFEDVDVEDISFNQAQRILLVGFGVEGYLQRMIEWLSNEYEVPINAVVLTYVKIQGCEFIARTMIVPEEVEREKAQRQQKRIKIQTSDQPGGMKMLS